jgi:membrane fusion protein, copper/silver efflux system
MKKAARFILFFLLLAGTFLAGWRYGHRPAANSASVSAGRTILYYVDPMHPAYKSDKPGIAPDCGMELVAVYADQAAQASADDNDSSSAPGGTSAISPEKQQLIGLRVARVEKKASGRDKLRLFGRVVPDETRVYRINAGIDGSIREVLTTTTGSQVKKNQLLATYVAPDFVAAIQQYILALNATDHLKQSGTNVSTQIDPVTGNPTNTNFQQRLQKLENMGMAAAQIADIERTRELPKNIHIFSPADGFVLARNVSPGLKFDRGAELYRIADLRRVWILADVFGREARMVRSGTTARVSVPDQNLVFQARVSEVLPQFDPGSRSFKVRLELENPGYTLRPDMFVDVELPIELPPAITVPADAVMDSGLKRTVFVDRGNGFFEPRDVETGWRFADKVEVVNGLASGEQIVVSGTFLLDSESRLKSAASRMDVASKDPACGMEVNQSKARASGKIVEFHGKTYFFCSDRCKRDFEKLPERYLKKLDALEQKHIVAAVESR